MSNYVQGLYVLRGCIPNEGLKEYYVLEARLVENLQKEDLYGATQTSKSDRFVIIDQLNKLALRYSEQSFNDMCNDQPVKRTQQSAVEAASTQPGKPQITHQEVPLLPAKTNIELLTPIVPTAYYNSLNQKANDFPLLRVTIDATDPQCGDAVLQIHTWIEDYSDRDIRTVILSRGEVKQVPLFPLLKHDVVRKLNEVRTVTLHMQIRHTKPVDREYYNTKQIRLLAYDAALLALELRDETVIDLSHYLAAWVTPHDQSITGFLRTVARYHPKQQLDGYPDLDECPDPALHVRKQAQAVYEALKYEVQLRYINTSLPIGHPNEQIVQHVKLPAETLASGHANCLDGVVLFASILKAIDLQPVIMLEMGHAYLGWKIFVRGEPVHYEFLETTLIKTAEFKEAHQCGLKRYQRALNNGWLDQAINNPYGYVRRVDVTQCHKDGILPLA